MPSPRASRFVSFALTSTALVLLAGCYAEITAGGYTPVGNDTASVGYGLGVNVGAYTELDGTTRYALSGQRGRMQGGKGIRQDYQQDYNWAEARVDVPFSDFDVHKDGSRVRATFAVAGGQTTAGFYRPQTNYKETGAFALAGYLAATAEWGDHHNYFTLSFGPRASQVFANDMGATTMVGAEARFGIWYDLTHSAGSDTPGHGPGYEPPPPRPEPVRPAADPRSPFPGEHACKTSVQYVDPNRPMGDQQAGGFNFYKWSCGGECCDGLCCVSKDLPPLRKEGQLFCGGRCDDGFSQQRIGDPGAWREPGE